MSVRIIAGLYKGRKLQTPPGQHTRPLLDRIKQSLFDYLGQDLSDLRVADVCAGSGSFGFEAASRNAAQVHLIECDRNALTCLQTNKQTLKSDVCIIHAQPFQRVLPSLQDLDVIYADPPFPWYREDPKQLAELVLACLNSLAPDGRFLIRGDKGQRLPQLPDDVRVHTEKRYGRSWIVELRHNDKHN